MYIIKQCAFGAEPSAVVTDFNGFHPEPFHPLKHSGYCTYQLFNIIKLCTFDQRVYITYVLPVIFSVNSVNQSRIIIGMQCVSCEAESGLSSIV
jgi:hypothetical protein